MKAVILSLPVARAAQQLEALSESFRTLEYGDIPAAVANILGRLSAGDAIAATRRYGLSVPRSRKECIEAVTRAIAERKESWDRTASIGSRTPFTF